MTKPEDSDDSIDQNDQAAIDAILDSRAPLPQDVARDPNLRILAAIAAVQRQISADGAPAPQQGRPEQPDPIEGLTIIGPVGSGAFADVFRAHDHQLGRDVAVKVLSATNQPGVALNEGRLLARVRHPNVVTVYGIKPLHDGVALEMEFVDGETLARLVQGSGALSPDEVIRVGIALSDALSAVHAAGLLHRDIKAQNVMRERHTGRIVLMDFGSGVAREPHRDREDMAGTPIYTAPELWQGTAPSQRSDIYSLGVLLFFLLSGSFPVEAAGLGMLKRRHRDRQYRTLGQVNPRVPRALSTVVQKAVSADPENRFASADALAAALRTAERAMRARHHVGIALAAASFLILVSGSVFVAARLHATRNIREPQFVKIPPDDAGHSSSAGGRIWPFKTSAGGVQLFDVVRGQAREVMPRPDDGVITRSLVSPHEDRLAYTVRASDRSYRLETAALDGGLKRVVIQPEWSFEPDPVSWSRDEALLLCWLRQRNGSLDLATVPTSGKPPRVLLTRSNREEPGGSLSPDGKFVAIENWTDPETPATELLSVPTDGSAPISLYSDPRHPRAPLWAADNEHVFFLMDSQTVSGAQDGWVLKVRDGRREGAASLVAANLGTGPQISDGLTDQDELVSRTSRSTSEIYLHSVDPDNAAAAGPPDRISIAAVDRHAGASYSPDGQSIAYFELDDPLSIGANVRPVLTILDRGTHRSRRVPLSMAFLGFVRPRWSHDGTVVSVFGRDRPDPARTGYYKVDLRVATATPIVLLKNWAGAHVSDWGADDDHFLYPDVTRGLVRRDLRSGIETILVGADKFGGWFAKGPDGSIAFVPRDSNRRTLAVRQPDGSSRTLLTAPPGVVLHVHAWSEDGKYIFFTAANGESAGSIFRIPSAGGRAQDLHVPWMPNPNPVAVSPDGRQLAVTEVSVDHELRFFPLRFPN